MCLAYQCDARLLSFAWTSLLMICSLAALVTDMLSVWDIKFGTLQGQREMRAAEPELRQAATHGNVYQVRPHCFS